MMEFEFPKYNLDLEFDDDTGFPFDTPHSTASSASAQQAQQPPPTTFGAREDSRLRFEDHLRDIATRYPEFAEHIRPSAEAGAGGSLRGFPRSGRDRAQQRRDPWGRDDFDFGQRFDIPAEFGGDGRFARPREFYPPNTQTYPASPPQFPADSRPPVYPQPAPTATGAPPPVPAKPTPPPPQPKPASTQGIQQSSTVDLGQVQPPSTSASAEGATEAGRGQRSMSAPPTNGAAAAGKRYVSSIQIPVLQPVGQQEMGASNTTPKLPPPPQPQHQQTPNKPHEYVIPIHIEGRDEPIIPKPNHQAYMQQQPPSSAPPTNQPLFNTMKDQYKQQQEQIQREQQQKFYEQQQQQQQQQRDSEPPEQPRAQIVKPSPLEMIQLIQKDVSELMGRVDKFAGRPKDKDYIYLDEMLTRNLLKLDNIETEGKDAIRQARREAIKCIESCIGILEAKANQNAMKAESVALAIEDKTIMQEGVQKSSSSGSNKEAKAESEVKSTGVNATAEVTKTL